MFKTILILAVICFATAQSRFLVDHKNPVAVCLHDAVEAKISFLQGAIDVLSAKSPLEGLKLILEAGADAVSALESCIHITKADVENYVENHLTPTEKECANLVFDLLQDAKACLHGFGKECILKLMADGLKFDKTYEKF